MSNKALYPIKNFGLEKIGSSDGYLTNDTSSFTFIDGSLKNTSYINGSEIKLVVVNDKIWDTDSLHPKISDTQNSYGFTYGPSIIEDVSVGMRKGTKMIDDNVSYQLLRVNPKLTGNVKIVVDSSSQMFVDTFPVTKVMADKRYKKIPVNENSYYGNVLMESFKNVPTEDFYGMEIIARNLLSSVATYNEQIYDRYNYGVRTNRNTLYSENFAILAPLCIRRVMPDFFLVFKIGDTSFLKNDDAKRIEYCIKNGELIKSFDLRENSRIGKFIRKIHEQSKKYPGYGFRAYDKDAYNIYTGISVENGNLMNAYESVLFDDGIKNQTDLNNTITEGFERNRLVAKDIVNFEFMFNDDSADDFSVNNYFGVYVKMNGEEKTFGVLRHESAPIPGFVFDDASIKSKHSSLSRDSSAVYGICDNDSFYRIKNITDDVFENFVAKLGENIYSSDFFEVKSDNIHKSYINVKVNHTPLAGEIYRVINKDSSTVYNVVVTNVDISDDSSYGISYISKTVEGTITSYTESLYIKDTEKTNEYLSKAFNGFAEFGVTSEMGYDDKSFNVFTSFSNAEFEFISSQVNLSTENVLENIDYITLHGRVQTSHASNEISEEYLEMKIFPYKSYSYICSDFLCLDTYHNYCVDYEIDVTKFKTTKYLNGRTFDGIEINNERYYYLPSCNREKPYLIPFQEEIKGYKKILIHNIHQINIGPCSILQVKDFDTTILNSKERFPSNANIGLKSDYCIDKIYPLLSTKEEEHFIHYVNPKTNVTDMSDITSGSLEISLFAPTSCKWKIVGTDKRIENSRIMYSNEILSDSYYMVTQPKDIKFGILERKTTYHPDSSLSYRKYTPNSIYSLVQEKNNPYIGKYAIDDILHGNLTISDVLYSSSNHDNAMSTVYISGEHSVDFISGGIKFRITTHNSDIVDVVKYQNYSAAFIQIASPNKKTSAPVDIIIDETSQEILIVLYTASSSLDVDSSVTKSRVHRIYTNAKPYDVEYDDDFYVPYDASVSSFFEPSDVSLVGVAFGSMEESPKYQKNKNFVLSDSSKNTISVTDSSTRIKLSDASLYFDGSLCGSSLKKTDYLLNVISTSSPLDGFALYSEEKTVLDVSSAISFEKFKSLIENVGVYIKRENETLSFVNRTNVLNLQVVDIYNNNQVLVHPTYIEPVMKNMLDFKYSDGEMNVKLGRNLNGANIFVSDVKRIDKIWANKVLEPDSSVGTFGIDVFSDWSIMSTPVNCVYKSYGKTDTPTVKNGVECGAEITNFFGARGIKLPKKLNLTKWKEEMFNNDFILINLSRNLRYRILRDNVFSSMWEKYKFATDEDKILYINNNIMKYFNIETAEIDIWKRKTNKNDTPSNIVLEDGSGENDDMYDKLSNVSRDVYLENGEYFLKINNLSRGKFKIKVVL